MCGELIGLRFVHAVFIRCFCARRVNRSAIFSYCSFRVFFACSVLIGLRRFTAVVILCFCAWRVSRSAYFYWCPFSLFFARGAIVGLRLFTTVFFPCFLSVVCLSACAILLLSLIAVFCGLRVSQSVQFWYCPYSMSFARGFLVGLLVFSAVFFRRFFCARRVNRHAFFLPCPYLFFWSVLR